MKWMMQIPLGRRLLLWAGSCSSVSLVLYVLGGHS